MSPVQSFAIDHPLSLLALNVFGDQIGLPVPSYPSLVLAGAFASEHGAPEPALIIAMALMVCLLADSIWYCMGLRFGEALTWRICRRFPKMQAAFSRGLTAYLKYGPGVLIAAKFVPGAGAISTLLAGQMAMPKSSFVVYSMLGSLLWSSSALALGAGFGKTILYVFQSLQGYWLLGLAAVAIGGLSLMALSAARSALKPPVSRPVAK